MNKNPWLQSSCLNLASLILNSYELAYGEVLLKTKQKDTSNIHKGKMLFAMENPLLAHDCSKDPYLNYANKAALKLWDICWEEMIKMPSRLTAPEEARKERRAALHYAEKNHAISNYVGIRINRKGERFIIKNAHVWTIWNHKGNPLGQAATFNKWERISISNYGVASTQS